jgi:hypothetical protein
MKRNDNRKTAKQGQTTFPAALKGETLNPALIQELSRSKL